MRNAVVVLVVADLVFVLAVREARGQVALALDGHALDQEACRHLVVRAQHQNGVELLGLQHVVLQHIRQALQLFMVVAVQWHHALIGLLARVAVLGVERDGTASATGHIEHLAQPRIVGHRAVHRGGGTQAQVGLHLGHRQLDRPVTKNLQHQRAVELDVRLHQHAGRGHLAEQFAHGCRVGASGGVARAHAQDLGPCLGQAHQHAAHGHAIEKKLVEFRHAGIPEKSRARWAGFRPACAGRFESGARCPCSAGRSGAGLRCARGSVHARPWQGYR